MSNIARWSPLAGIAFIVLWIIAFNVSNSPDSGDSNTKILAYYASSGHRTRDVTVLFLALAGLLFFIWFLTALRSRLPPAPGGGGPPAPAAVGGGGAPPRLWGGGARAPSPPPSRASGPARCAPRP